MNVKHVGSGNVMLLAGGGKIFTDIAARFCRSEKSLEDILASEYDRNIVANILNSGHLAATEFDYFIFGIEGYARVTEIQLVRKRIASYLVKSGRPDKKGKRSFDMVLPESIMNVNTNVNVDISKCSIDGFPLIDIIDTNNEQFSFGNTVNISIDTMDLLNFTEIWYNTGVKEGYREEELRYMKQQATEFKAIIGMNAHALIDWWKIRMCMNAQTEINHLARKMHSLCKEAAPDLFEESGASCVCLGYCPENDRQHPSCKGKILTKNEAMRVLNDYKNFKTIHPTTDMIIN